MRFYENECKAEEADLAQSIEHDFANQLKTLEQQHKEFVNHSNSLISKYQGQLEQQIEQQKQQQSKSNQLNYLAKKEAYLFG